MKLFLVSAVAAALSSAAFAGASDRYNDLKLDTSETAKHSVSSASDASAIVFSSRSKGGTKGEGFPYGGFGKGNDSR
ncbi:hypothetical protein ABMC88_00705 [Sulfitobacter sp. HNIBRBA2951]|uniref:hypothetical protein n=1 Tax=Sulfitobacter aquimarinus TaxID=3158557 RepID=UPI0032E031DE